VPLAHASARQLDYPHQQAPSRIPNLRRSRRMASSLSSTAAATFPNPSTSRTRQHAPTRDLQPLALSAVPRLGPPATQRGSGSLQAAPAPLAPWRFAWSPAPGGDVSDATPRPPRRIALCAGIEPAGRGKNAPLPTAPCGGALAPHFTPLRACRPSSVEIALHPTSSRNRARPSGPSCQPSASSFA
jgi:hypothetical protein